VRNWLVDPLGLHQHVNLLLDADQVLHSRVSNASCHVRLISFDFKLRLFLSLLPLATLCSLSALSKLIDVSTSVGELLLSKLILFDLFKLSSPNLLGDLPTYKIWNVRPLMTIVYCRSKIPISLRALLVLKRPSITSCLFNTLC